MGEIEYYVAGETLDQKKGMLRSEGGREIQLWLQKR